jgi:ABC-2 type transport system ATP-binding protein
VTAPPIIRTDGLTRRFGDFTAVNDVHLAVQPGTIFAFLGANGSGKSTTIRMLIGLLTPTAGQIEVDGVDVVQHPRKVRDHIGYMGQRVSLYAGLSLRENVEFYAGLYGLSDADLAHSWGTLRERFGLGAVEGEQAQELPGGIRQRAGLALSILHQPRVLFLDEPTAGVDVHSRGLFWDLIQEEADAGVTVFVTTHFLEEVEYCDHVSFIDAGRVIADGDPESLRSRFRDAYRVHVDVAATAETQALAVLGPLADARVPSARGIDLHVATLDDDVLARLAALEQVAPTHVDALPMTEIFRRILAEQDGRA